MKLSLLHDHETPGDISKEFSGIKTLFNQDKLKRQAKWMNNVFNAGERGFVPKKQIRAGYNMKQ